jgi:hypothetical protein
MTSGINKLFFQFLLIILSGFSGSIKDVSETINRIPFLEEKENVDDIEFTFSLLGNQVKISGRFQISSELECTKDITFNFDHKKNYTLGVNAFLLEKTGLDWYEVYFIIEKYYFTKVKALYHYAIDDENNEINFHMKSSEVNIESFNIVKSSSGSFRFNKNGDKTDIQYDLNYDIEPTIFLKTLYNIQKKESIRFLTDYKTYLENHCELKIQ